MFTGGHCETVGPRRLPAAGRPGLEQPPLGLGVRERASAVDVVTADGELVRADATQNSDLFWAARGAGPGFPGVVTRFHLRTYPAEPMWHDTLDVRARRRSSRCCTGCTTCCPGSDRRVEPVLARRRRAAASAGDGAAAAHDVMADRRGGRATCSRRSTTGRSRGASSTTSRGPTTIAEENVAQTAAEPRGLPLRRRTAPGRTRAPTCSRPLLRDIWRELRHRALVLDLVRLGADARRCPTWRSRCEGNVYVATYAIWTGRRRRRALPRVGARPPRRGSRRSATASTRRHRLHAAPGPRSWPTRTAARLEEIRARARPGRVS